MGGFYGEVTKDIFIRWSQFGLFTSHSRLHGTTTRQPWAYDDETKVILKKFVDLRYELMPYIWKTASECVRDGVPFIRPMVLEYPDDKNVRAIYDQYFFGNDILAAPVFGGDMARREVYLPEGCLLYTSSQACFILAAAVGDMYPTVRCAANLMPYSLLQGL